MDRSIDLHFARAQRALLSAGLCLSAGPVAQIGAMIGPYIPAIGILLVLAGAVLLLGGIGCLISVAFIGIPTPTPETSERYWRGDGMSVSAPIPEPEREDEPCHCTNCLNTRTW